jgi:hypothetical protein
VEAVKNKFTAISDTRVCIGYGIPIVQETGSHNGGAAEKATEVTASSSLIEPPAQRKHVLHIPAPCCDDTNTRCNQGILMSWKLRLHMQLLVLLEARVPIT